MCGHRLAEGEFMQVTVVMRRERTFTFGVGDVLEPGIWEVFTFLGVGICWS